MSNIKDEWETPQDLYEWLNSIYHFKIDLCANKHNNKSLCFAVDMFLFEANEMPGNAFMNPPYSNIGPFIEKAWELSQFVTVVCLIPSSVKHNRYVDFLDRYNGNGYIRYWRKGVKWKDLSKRTHFKHPTAKISTPAFGCSLLILNKSKQ